jgi:hypothetical protein
VWSHKALLKVVSHTPIEVETLARFQAAHDWVDLGRQIAAPERYYSWWSYRAKDWRVNDKGRRLDHIWASASVAAQARSHRFWRTRAIGKNVRTTCRSSPSSICDERDAARALDALRHGWAVRVGPWVLLPAETGFGAGVASTRMLISAARATTLKLANQRDAAEPESPVMIRGADGFDLRWPAPWAIRRWISPIRSRPVSGPADRRSCQRGGGWSWRVWPASCRLPCRPQRGEEAQEVSAADLADWKDRHLSIASRPPAGVGV